MPAEAEGPERGGGEGKIKGSYCSRPVKLRK